MIEPVHSGEDGLVGHKIQFCFQRYEKKYLLTPEQYGFLRERLGEYMEPDEYGQYTIFNIYYDTPDFRLIRTSLEGPVYKEKLRMRSYGVPGEEGVFVEIKKKFRGVVYKRRVVMDPQEAADYLAGRGCAQEGQIRREIDWFLDYWKPEPKVFLAYEREALAGRADGDLRVTFDTGLRWRAGDLDLRLGGAGEPLLPPDRVLMEVKIPGTAPVWLGHMLSEGKIFPTSFSKYGLCYRQHLAGGAEIKNKKAVLSCA